MRITAIALFLAMFLPMFMLGACGVKPSAVDPPNKAAGEKDEFPRTYPDPATDPSPGPNPHRLIK